MMISDCQLPIANLFRQFSFENRQLAIGN